MNDQRIYLKANSTHRLMWVMYKIRRIMWLKTLTKSAENFAPVREIGGEHFEIVENNNRHQVLSDKSC